MAEKAVAYVAGDHHITFPAVVALKTLEDHNPGKFHRVIVYDADDLTRSHRELLEHYGIEFIDAKSVPAFNRLKSLPLMKEGRWPAEVFLNWALPEHFAELGHRYSLKLDYDVMCLGRFITVDRAIRNGRKVAFRKLRRRYRPKTEEVGAEFKRLSGLEYPSGRMINVGVGFFDNEAMKRAGYFDLFCRAYSALMEVAPETAAMEQVALAAASEPFGDGYTGLLPAMNTFARGFSGNFNPDAPIRIVHFNGRLKPWTPLDDRHYDMAYRRGDISSLLLREIWLEQAQNVRMFETFTDQRPFTPMQHIRLAKMLEKKLHEAQP